MKALIGLVLFFCIGNIYGQSAPEVESKLTNFNQEKIQSIELIKKNLINAKNKLASSEKALENETDPKRKIIIESEVKKIQERYDKLKLNLISVITDIKMEEIQKDDLNKKRDYLQEAQELLGPAFDTIQRISERPRKIEALRKELHTYQEKLALTQLALSNIDVVKSSPEFKALLPDIEVFLGDATYNVNDLAQEFTLKIDRIKRDLNELTKDNQTIVGAASELSKQFFSTKGKHLGISILLFIFTVWSLTALKNKVVLNLLRRSKIEWLYKPIGALYGALTFIFALTLSIFSLYIMGDWVLVTIIVLIISALLWGSKSYIVKYLAEGRLILNLGTIKEGELVIFRDIPWKVKNINFVTIFENEFLDSSIIRIEISHIFKMHSRKILDNEQWFPTRSNDWVLLADGTFGQVKLQTVEQIVIELKSAERKYYTTTDYLNSKPVNLSHGFTIDLLWGLDYSIQAELNTELVPKIHALFKQQLQNYATPCENFTIDFHSVGENCLNLYIEARFNGEFASQRLILQRELQKIMLNITNELKLNIPFRTVKLIGESSKSS